MVPKTGTESVLFSVNSDTTGARGSIIRVRGTLLQREESSGTGTLKTSRLPRLLSSVVTDEDRMVVRLNEDGADL